MQQVQEKKKLSHTHSHTFYILFLLNFLSINLRLNHSRVPLLTAASPRPEKERANDKHRAHTIRYNTNKTRLLSCRCRWSNIILYETIDSRTNSIEVFITNTFPHGHYGCIYFILKHKNNNDERLLWWTLKFTAQNYIIWNVFRRIVWL